MTFVEAHRHTVGVAPLLAAIGEPMSTFYHRTSRVPSVRAVADAVVAERIEEIWQQSRRSYGAPRIHAMLAREGIRVGRKRVERLMRGLGIQGAHLHKPWKTTRPDRRVTAAPDLVERQFQAAAPNTLWVADLTYIKTLQGILYLAVVLDVFSCRSRGREFKSRQPDSEVLAVPTSSESRRPHLLWSPWLQRPRCARPGGACPRCGGVGHVGDLWLRKFAHLNSRLRRPKNVSHLINAAGRPALDQVAHLWIANRGGERAGKVRPHDGERTPPQSDWLEGQPRCDLEVVECACNDLVADAQCFLALPPAACV